MFKNWNWKTPVLDLILLMVAANLTIFYENYEEIGPDYRISSPGSDYWSYMVAAFVALCIIKAGTLAFFAAEDRKAGGRK
jgi:hypothetical protein